MQITNNESSRGTHAYAVSTLTNDSSREWPKFLPSRHIKNTDAPQPMYGVTNDNLHFTQSSSYLSLIQWRKKKISRINTGPVFFFKYNQNSDREVGKVTWENVYNNTLRNLTGLPWCTCFKFEHRFDQIWPYADRRLMPLVPFYPFRYAQCRSSG